MLIKSNRITYALSKLLKRAINSSRPPDFIIGGLDDPYMLRWYYLRTRFFSIYLHEFHRSDDDVHHDHPWRSASIALGYMDRARGFLIEEVASTQRAVIPGDIVVRSAEFAHRIVVVRPGFRTLFFMGPRYREWGFVCKKRWVHWKEFTYRDERGSNVWRGCGEE
jgi:hypothetical protein